MHNTQIQLEVFHIETYGKKMICILIVFSWLSLDGSVFTSSESQLHR